MLTGLWTLPELAEHYGRPEHTIEAALSRDEIEGIEFFDRIVYQGESAGFAIEAALTSEGPPVQAAARLPTPRTIFGVTYHVDQNPGSGRDD